MEIPPFSIFSAISEIFVTIIVLYVIVGALRGGPLRWKLLGGALIFEIAVNVIYMAIRAAKTDADPQLASWMKLLAAGHGILSLLMLVGLIVMFLLAVVDEKSGRPGWFRRNAGVTWGFLVLWLISVASGELFFVLRYLV